MRATLLPQTLTHMCIHRRNRNIEEPEVLFEAEEEQDREERPPTHHIVQSDSERLVIHVHVQMYVYDCHMIIRLITPH